MKQTRKSTLSSPSNHPPKKYKARPLTIRERRYIQARIAGQNMYRSALAAGFGNAMAKNAGVKIERKPKVQAALERWIEREGLSDQDLGMVI